MNISNKSLLSVLCIVWTAMPAAAFSNELIVYPGQSIRAAVQAAQPGDTIIVKPGIYTESGTDNKAVTVSQDGITIIGENAVLKSNGTQKYGFVVAPTDTSVVTPANEEDPTCSHTGNWINGFSLGGFTIQGFANDGVYLACVKGFILSNNKANYNGVYGLFPIFSEQGVLTNNEAKNTSSDAALYVGRSKYVQIIGNTAHHSLIGIQLENSQFCTIANNRVYNNRIGVLVDKTPGYTPQGTEFSTSNNFIYSNIITNNNSSIQSSEGLPTGAGMILAGADKTTIVGNQVSNNKSTGILVSSFTCPPPGCGALPFDLVPDGNKIVWNIVRKNGNAPDPSIGPLAADLSWDTTGHNNCWEHNQFGTSFLPSLPSCN